MTHKYSTSIVGSRGYSGLELARLLLKHPGVDFTHAFATQAFKLSDDLLVEGVERVQCLPDSELMSNLTDVVFLATPAEVSLRLAPKIIQSGSRVIDLSGAFRLQKNDTMKWYGFTHDDPALLKEAHYGLVPFAAPLTAKTRLVSNPGCYATAIAMATVPLLKQGLIDPSNLVIDAKSGTTGAGRKASENTLFSEVEGECLPYRVGRHQHLPEIQESVEAFSQVAIEPHLVTHLLPVKRGITAGIYAQTLSKGVTIKDVTAAYDQAFHGYPLVRHGEDIGRLGKLKHVVGTPMTHLSYALNGQKLYVFSVIDNLLKGAASQAVENLNRLLDLPPAYNLRGEG